MVLKVRIIKEGYLIMSLQNVFLCFCNIFTTKNKTRSLTMSEQLFICNMTIIHSTLFLSE